MPNQRKLNIGFINPPHADWSLANNLTYLQCKSHYERFGKYRGNVHWIPALYRWNKYESFTEVLSELADADIILFSSYVWNAELLDQLAQYIKNEDPKKILVIGGPHIGTNHKELLKQREDLYDFIARPTRPGEIFIQNLIDEWFESPSESIEATKISWELRSPRGDSLSLDQDYSVYEDNIEYLCEILDYAKEHRLEPFISLETTRGCPYQCVYCEWGGGIGTKILKKPLDLVKRDILALKKAGFVSAYLTDANYGVFQERDFEIFKFAWDNGINLTDISTVKTPILEKRKELVDYFFEVVGDISKKKVSEKNATDMWGRMEYISIVPTVSLQSVSDEAMKVAKRKDLSSKDKIRLSKYIHQRCEEYGFPRPALELILGMPGSTLDDFYEEMNIIWSFRAWTSFRHDYMFLPDSELNSDFYKQKYKIETVQVFSDIVDEDGIDNFKSLYRKKETHFETIRSCFSYTAEELAEMWFMDKAGNYLLKNVYPNMQDLYSPSDFARKSFFFLKQFKDFLPLWEEILDIFNPQTPPRSIRKLGGRFRVDTIEDFLKNHELFLKNYLTVEALTNNKRESLNV